MMRSLLCGLVNSDASDSEKRPATIGEDDKDVYQIHSLDQIKFCQTLVVWTLYFDHVLDAKKLETSLSRLLEIGDWRKVGARLRFDQDGVLSSWAPKKFTEEHPAILFHQTSHADMSIDKHRLRFLNSQPGKHAFTSPFGKEQREGLLPAHFPRTFNDLVQRQLPQLSLHVISFCDATIVQTCWPHTLSDALGQQALLRNWSLVLAGREQDVERIIGVQHDVLKRATQDCKEAYLVEEEKQTRLQRMHALCQALWQVYTRSRLEARIMFLPAAAYQRLLSEARNDVASGEKRDRQTTFISDADILAAWLVQLMARAESNPRQDFVLLHTVNARFRLPILRPRDAGGVYMQNMVCILRTDQTAPIKASVGEMALHHRRQLLRHATEQQVLATIKSAQDNIKNGVIRYPVSGNPKNRPLFLNNLGPMNLITVIDFSHAVVSCDDGHGRHENGAKFAAREHLQGKMRYFVQWTLGSRYPLPGFLSKGEDHAGNLWLAGLVQPSHWATIEDELRRL